MMLKSISWGAYLQILLVALSAYYLIVLALYFRSDIYHLLLGLSPKLANKRGASNQKEAQNKVAAPIHGQLLKDSDNLATGKTDPNGEGYPNFTLQNKTYHAPGEPVEL